MDFDGISKKEAALIWMLQTGLDINDAAKINSVYAKIKEKNMLSSDFAKLYEEELTHLKDGLALNNECISCGSPLADGEFAICGSCMKKIASYAKDGIDNDPDTNKNVDITEETIPQLQPEEPISEALTEETTPEISSDEPEPESLFEEETLQPSVEQSSQDSSRKQKIISIAYEGGKEKFKEKYVLKDRLKERKKADSERLSKSKQQRNITKLLIIISAILFVCVIVLSIAFLRMSMKTSSALNDILQNMPQNVEGAYNTGGNSYNIEMLDTFGAYAKIQGYTLMAGQPAEEGSVIYEIIPSNDYLILFYNNEGNQTGTALQMNDDSEDAQIEQLTLMAFLLASVYDDLSLSQAGEFLEQEIISGDMVVRGNYSWNLAKLEDKVVLMGIDIRYMDE